jgi:hypothetical protein
MNENIELTIKLLGDFKKNMDKRADFFLNLKVLPKLLEWHFEIWSRDTKLLGDANEAETLELWAKYSELSNLLDSIYADIEEKVLSISGMDAFMFFDATAKHLSKYKNKAIKVKESEHYYAENLLAVFYRIFFKKIYSAPGRFDIWRHYFPEEWKIKSNSVKESVIQRVTLKEFLEWIAPKISQKEPDLSLNDVSSNLFPEVDPVWWGTIIIFLMSPFDPNDRVRYVIEQEWIFSGSRIISFSGYSDDKIEIEKQFENYRNSLEKEEKEKTLELVVELTKIVPIFYHTFSKDNLKKFIAEAVFLQLSYQEDKDKEIKRRRLLEIFESLQSKIDNKV